MSRMQRHLPRLDPEHYRGLASVHWTMTLHDRRTGWLSAATHSCLREFLIHTLFRYALVCPVYCCMPDHLHLVWTGASATSDQRLAVKYFRRHFNALLFRFGMRLQRQAYDHVLRPKERAAGAFEAAAEYIFRNPERAGIVPADEFRSYAFSGCAVPGYPDLVLLQPDYWDQFWRAYASLQQRGFRRPFPETGERGP